MRKSRARGGKKGHEHAKTFPAAAFDPLAKCYLDEGDVQERAAEPDGEGGGEHDGRAGEEAHGHGVRRHLVPARDDPGLQRHEQPCTNTRDQRPDSVSITVGLDSRNSLRVH